VDGEAAVTAETGHVGGKSPQRFNMAAYAIGRAARSVPGKPALIVIGDARREDAAEVWTYAALEEAVLRLAGALRDAGLAPQDRLLIRLGNTSTYPLLFFGAIAGGLVPIPASPELTAREAAFLLADSAAAAVALDPRLPLEPVSAGVRVFDAAEIMRMMRNGQRAEYADTEAEAPAFLVYTSGTTAQPKGVLHAHRSAWGRRPMYQGWYGMAPDDRVLHAGAFNWTYTLGAGLTDPWANGATSMVYTGAKEPALWPQLIRTHRATLFAAVPSVYRQILKYAAVAPGALGPLRHGLIAGETAAPELFEEWTRRTGTELYEAFGLTELSTFISSSPSVPRRPGFVGRPQEGRRVAILAAGGDAEPLPPHAEGLIAVCRSDPGLMLGYWRRPAEEAEVFRGGWFIGGDLGLMDEAGYVAHRGRVNDIMNALGYRVSPLEVETALMEHPAIAEVAAAEVPVRADVSVIGAFVVAKEGAPLSADEVKAFAAQRLAPYKCPREVVFVEALPRTANGKLRRSELRALYRPGRSRA
jgi:acyl-coenzyme A synthetase/AMP-(fatty) acid ligase